MVLTFKPKVKTFDDEVDLTYDDVRAFRNGKKYWDIFRVDYNNVLNVPKSQYDLITPIEDLLQPIKL